jgi:indole-3-glycerol phosphate synthase
MKQKQWALMNFIVAACLSQVVKRLAECCSLGLEVLHRLHDATELEHICDETILVGVNNRNLKILKLV